MDELKRPVTSPNSKGKRKAESLRDGDDPAATDRKAIRPSRYGSSRPTAWPTAVEVDGSRAESTGMPSVRPAKSITSTVGRGFTKMSLEFMTGKTFGILDSGVLEAQQDEILVDPKLSIARSVISVSNSCQ